MTWPEAFVLVGTTLALAGMVVGIVYFGTRR